MLGSKDVRRGTLFQLQCDGTWWQVGLGVWKACEEERCKEAKKRKEGQPSSQTSFLELSDEDF